MTDQKIIKILNNYIINDDAISLNEALSNTKQYLMEKTDD